ncbi:MAG: ribonuclease III [Spirosomataceae bacterium]
MLFILGFFKSDSKEKEFKKAVELIVGEKPSNLMLYQLAFRHTSASKETNIGGFRESNERLEYLGDSVLGMVIAEYLFKKYPFKDEGFLTEIRSRIVNRESLNQVARKIGLDKLVEFDGHRIAHNRTSMYGDAMEALIGAIYLDKGFRFTRKYILNKLIANYFDLDTVIQTNTNYKSILLSWAQQEGKKIEFSIIQENGKHHYKEFVAQITVNGDAVSTGGGWNKKKAEQEAARRACEALEIKAT